MLLKVLLFARARDLLNSSDIEVEVPEECTVADLRSKIRSAYPELAEFLASQSVQFAVDLNYVCESFKLNSTAEIAIIPPVSGG